MYKRQPFNQPIAYAQKVGELTNMLGAGHILVQRYGDILDGKLSLSYEVGGDLPSLIGEEFAQELINYTDKIYLEFGADPHVEGIYTCLLYTSGWPRC